MFNQIDQFAYPLDWELKFSAAPNESQPPEIGITVDAVATWSATGFWKLSDFLIVPYCRDVAVRLLRERPNCEWGCIQGHKTLQIVLEAQVT